MPAKYAFERKSQAQKAARARWMGHHKAFQEKAAAGEGFGSKVREFTIKHPLVTAGALAGAAAAPMLATKATASLRGLSILKKAGGTAKQMGSARKILGMAYGTYATIPLGTFAATAPSFYFKSKQVKSLREGQPLWSLPFSQRHPYITGLAAGIPLTGAVAGAKASLTPLLMKQLSKPADPAMVKLARETLAAKGIKMVKVPGGITGANQAETMQRMMSMGAGRATMRRTEIVTNMLQGEMPRRLQKFSKLQVLSGAIGHQIRDFASMAGPHFMSATSGKRVARILPGPGAVPLHEAGHAIGHFKNPVERAVLAARGPAQALLNQPPYIAAPILMGTAAGVKKKYERSKKRR